MVSKLHRLGNKIVDVDGAEVKLDGVNAINILDTGAVYGYPLTQDLDGMMDWGVNCIRVLNSVENWVNNINNNREVVKQILSEANARDMYVVLCFWSIGNYGSGSVPSAIPYLPYSTDPLAASFLPDRQAFIDFWLQVGIELSSYDNLIFEFWNEVRAPSSALAVEAKSNWFETFNLIVSGLRGASIDNLVVASWGYGSYANLSFGGGGEWLDSWVEDFLATSPDENFILNTHLYRWDSAIHVSEPVRYNVFEASEVNLGFNYIFGSYPDSYPVLVGELGINQWWTGEELVKELEAGRNYLQECKNRGLHVLMWTWREGVKGSLFLDGNYTPSTGGEVFLEYMAVSLPEPEPEPEPEPSPYSTAYILNAAGVSLVNIHRFRPVAHKYFEPLIRVYDYFGPYASKIVSHHKAFKWLIRKLFNRRNLIG